MGIPPAYDGRVEFVSTPGDSTEDACLVVCEYAKLLLPSLSKTSNCFPQAAADVQKVIYFFVKLFSFLFSENWRQLRGIVSKGEIDYKVY